MATEKNIQMGKRLESLRGNLTQVEVSEKCGITQGMLSRYEKGTIPTSDILERIASYYNVTMGWIVKGDEDMKPGVSSPVMGATNKEQGRQSPVYRFAGAGPPQLTEYEPVAYFTVPPKLHKDTVVFVQVRGDSMEPLIRDRAVVGVDRENREFVEGGIFACWLPHSGVTIKKLLLRDRDSIILRSINNDIDDVILPASDLHDHLILGRVIWIAQDMPT